MPRDWNDVSNENVLSVLLLLDICSRKGKFSLQDAMSQIGYPYAQFSRYRRNPELLAPKFQGVFYNKGVEYLRKTGCPDDAFTPAHLASS
jgi:hypothetical protein